MSKFKKASSSKPDQKLTSFFPRRDSATSSNGLSSQPPSSPLAHNGTQNREFINTYHNKASLSSTSTSSRLKAKVNAPPRPDQEVISVSSTSSAKSHVSISSDSVQIISSLPAPAPAAPRKSHSRAVMSTVEFPHSPYEAGSFPHLDVSGATVSKPRVSLKHSRSPSILCVGTASAQSSGLSNHTTQPTPNPRTPIKRKKKFESDSDRSAGGSDAIIMVHGRSSRPPVPISPIRTSVSSPLPPITRAPKENRTMPPRKSSPKKTRYLGAQDQGRGRGGSYAEIPSSQSDEQELIAVRVVVKKDPKDVTVSINRWRQEASHDENDSWMMDLDADIRLGNVDLSYSSDLDAMQSSPLPSSEAEVSADLRSAQGSTVPTTPASPTFASASKKPATPPLGKITLPATPIALDAATKTAAIIARIKSDALAKSRSSPDSSQVLEFKELDESSEDDEDDLFKIDYKGKGVAKPSSAPLARYSLRDRRLSSSPPSPGSQSAPKRRKYTHASRMFETTTKALPQANHKQKKLFDPLDSLIAEQRLAEKRGHDAEAPKLAEKSTDIKIDEEDDDNENYEDEAGDEQDVIMDGKDAARRVVEEGSSVSPGSQPGNTTVEAAEVGEDEEKMLILGSGTQMKKILASDRVKSENVVEAKTHGVPLWSDHVPSTSDLPMAGIKVEFPSMGDQDPVLQLLAEPWLDTNQLALLIDSGMLNSLDPSKYGPLVPFLFQAAVSGSNLKSSSTAFCLLDHLWSKTFPEIPNMTRLISLALVRLGASLAVCDAMGWDAAGATNDFAEATNRTTAVRRLVYLVSLATKSGALANGNIPDAVMALVLVALDPSSFANLKKDIVVAISTICNAIQGADIITFEIERKICHKTLRFATSLEPVDMSFTVSLFSSGSGSAARIARWLAQCILLGDDILSSEMYSDLPPLSNLLKVISPALGSKCIFDIQTNANATNYDDLGHYVEILGIALTGIEGYVAEDRRQESASRPQQDIMLSPKKVEKPMTRIELVRSAIDLLHGKIVDTRAAHLDRSRTKAALQRLSMRIHYQRLSGAKAGPRLGQRRILDFLPKKSSHPPT